MTEPIDNLIQARFDAVATPLADGDWSDVLARARGNERRRRAPSRLLVTTAVAVFAVTVTAVAFGLPGRVVDFFKAPPAPQSVKTFFGAHGLGMPFGLNPNTKLGQPREIMTATFDANHLPPKKPTLHKLYVAPRDGGGFCYIWTDMGGTCADPLISGKARLVPAARPLSTAWLQNDYVGFVDGWIRGDAKTLVAHYADGTTAPVPVTWVSAPIDAGFFAYVVPDAHLTRADALTSVVALGPNGKVVGAQNFPLPKPIDEDVLKTLPDGTKLSMPRRAEAAHARELFSFRNRNGGRAWLWVMPRIGGGTCWVYGTGAGGGEDCPLPQWRGHVPTVDGGGEDGVYFALVRPNVASVELRYRNGDSERFTPKDGFVLHQMKHNSGLVEVAGLNRSGKAIFTEHLPLKVGGR